MIQNGTMIHLIIHRNNKEILPSNFFLFFFSTTFEMSLPTPPQQTSLVTMETREITNLVAPINTNQEIPISSATSTSAAGISAENQNPVGDLTDQDGIRRLIMEGFEVINSDRDLQTLFPDVQTAFPRIGAYPRQIAGSYKRIFLCVNQEAIWTHVAMKTSEKLDEKARDLESSENARKYYYKVSGKEVQIVLGLQLIFRGRKNLASIDLQFSKLPDHLESWPMSLKRYKVIASSLDADFAVLSSCLRASWKDAIVPGTECSVDEAMFGYHTRVDVSSPQRYIPRKPHPNGLLCYYAVFKTRFGPFVFDLEPDFNVNALNSRVALIRIMKRWEWEDLPHVIFDAGFSGDAAQVLLEDINVKFTASFNIAHKRWLFEVLKANCKANCWLAVTDPSGLVWSVMRAVEDGREHFLVTSAFKAGRPTTKTKLVTDEQTKNLSKFGIRGFDFFGGKTRC